MTPRTPTTMPRTRLGRTLRARRGLLVGLALLGPMALAPAAAAQTGKVAGRVTLAGTGEALPGANVIVVGTSYGAATDTDGAYFIIGVPPGTYAVRASMVGFGEVLAEDVRVQSGLTTPLDFALGETAVVGEEVVVAAERPVVQRDETASVAYLDLQGLREIPVASARDAIMLQSGVFFDVEPVMGGLGGSGRGEARYAVRGGDETQVKWFLDGVRAHAMVEGRADQGGSFTDVNLHAVQEIQILTGGFNAEYGDAQSGVVNVVTREGGAGFTGSFEYLYGPPGQRHFGNYIYDPATQREFLDHTLDDGTLDPAWWTPLRQSQVYDYRELTDHHAYASLGGPIFGGAAGPQATFFVASQYRREAYIYPRPRDHRELDDVTGNVVFRPRPTMRLKLSGLYSRTGHSTLQETGDFTSQVKFYRGWGSVLDDRTTLAAAHWTHSLSPRFFYDLRLSRYLLDVRETPSEFTRIGRSETPDLFGFQRFDGYEDEPFDAFAFVYDQHHQVGDVSLVGSANWQADASNLFKAGFEARYNTFAELRSFRFPSFSTDERDWLNRGLNETYHPLQFAAYLQDKMEFRGMILNVGLRYDYFDPNRDWFTTRDLFNLSVDPAYDAGTDTCSPACQIDADGDVLYDFSNVLEKPREPARSYHMVSPRLGVSFPITNNSVLHFSYGHFYQMPPLDRLFEFGYFRPVRIVEDGIREREEGGDGHGESQPGDPERVAALSVEPLLPAKTVSFEVGLVHNFGGVAVLDVTGFYKDVSNQTLPRAGLFDRTVFMYDPFRGTTSNVGFATNISGDYGSARGFEVALRTLFSRDVTLALNYSFSRSVVGRATPSTVRYDSAGVPAFQYPDDVNRRLPGQTTFSRPHVFRANLYLRYPDTRRLGLLSDVLRGTGLSLLGQYVSGRTFTYLGPDDPADTRDNHRFPAIRQVDLRLDRTFRAGGHHAFAAYVNVSNVFNTKNLRSYGDPFFDADATREYIENGTVTTVDGGGYDISWQTYFPPRRVVFGVRYTLQ
jgi:hypothetical protein